MGHGPYCWRGSCGSGPPRHVRRLLRLWAARHAHSAARPAHPDKSASSGVIRTSAQQSTRLLTVCSRCLNSFRPCTTPAIRLSPSCRECPAGRRDLLGRPDLASPRAPRSRPDRASPTLPADGVPSERMLVLPARLGDPHRTGLGVDDLSCRTWTRNLSGSEHAPHARLERTSRVRRSRVEQQVTASASARHRDVCPGDIGDLLER